MKSKRQTTMAKLARERLVQERRALKREKKQAAAAARAAEVAGAGPAVEAGAALETPADEAAVSVRELRRFIASLEGVDVEPGSETALQLDAARRAVAAYDEVQRWNVKDEAR
jgi:hypothetical protein